MSDDHDLPLPVARRIDALCEQFEQAWRAVPPDGVPPRPEEVTADLDGAARETLIYELLRLDVEYRRRAGHVPRADDYRGRFADLPHDRLVEATAGPGVTLALPAVVGYEMIEELGRGGMGVVYKALQVNLNRVVALKMLVAPGAVSLRTRDRFRREAEAVAALRHPGVVPVYEVGEEAGCPYLTMEFVPGGSLDRRLNGSPVPEEYAARLLVALARAVQHAHEHGVIHRDLKPANVLLDEAGAPKLADFGLAKRLVADDAGLTGSGDLIGTPSYMAPEQAGGAAAVGPWTDVYGLGAILYELLTGRPAFRAANAVATLLLIRESPPMPPRRIRAGLPRDLETICLKCLAKDPLRRYATAADLAADLERFLAGKPVQARPPRTVDRVVKWARRHPAVATLMVALAVAIAAGTIATLKQRDDAVQGRKDAELAAKARDDALDRFRIALAHREWVGENAARAADLLADCSDDQKGMWEWQYLNQLGRSRLGELSGYTGAVSGVVYRPDGCQLATSGQDGNVRLWDVTASPAKGVTLACNEGKIYTVVYQRDGGRLASGHESGAVLLWEPNGRAVGRLAPPEPPSPVVSLAYLVGVRLAVGRASGAVEVWDTTTRVRESVLLPRVSRLSLLAGSPDGRSLATTSFNGDVQVWDAATGDPVRTLPPHAADALAVTFSPDGQWLATGGWDRMVRVYDLATGREWRMLADHAGPVSSVAFSPDGRRLASAGLDGAMRVCDSATGRRLYALHGHTGPVAAVAFRPDGEALASAGHDRVVRLWDSTAGGQEAVALPFTHSPAALPICLAFDPTSTRVAAGLMRDDRVYLWNLQTAATTHLPPTVLSGPTRGIRSLAFRPDGRELVAVTSDGSVVTVDPADGTRTPILPNPGNPAMAAAYHPDGGITAVRRGATVGVWVGDAGRERQVTDLGPTNRVVVAFAADGGRVAVATGGRVAVVETRSGRVIDDRPATGVTAVALDNPGRVLAVVSADAVLLRHLDDGREVRCGNHAGTVFHLALAPDGRRLATSASDMTIRVWDTATGDGVLTLRGELHHRSPLAFSPDGRGVASVGTDVGLRLWTAAPPTSPADRRLAWRDHEAADCCRSGMWAAALVHLDVLAEARTGTDLASIRRRRGEAWAEMGKWDRAVAEFDAAATAGDATAARLRVAARLGAGDTAGFAREARRLAEDLNRLPAADRTEVVRLCVTRSDAAPDPAAMLTSHGPATDDRVRAAVAYRAGKFAESADLLRREVGRRGADVRAWEWLFLALAEHNLGRPGPAAKARARAAAWVERADRLDREGPPARSSGWTDWVERVMVAALRAEVDGTLGKDH